MYIVKDANYGMIDYSEKVDEVKAIIDLIYKIASQFGKKNYSEDHKAFNSDYNNGIIDVEFREDPECIGFYLYFPAHESNACFSYGEFNAEYKRDSEYLTVSTNNVNPKVIQNLRDLLEYEIKRHPNGEDFWANQSFEALPIENTPETFIKP